ncbi:hypothetical protein LCGC14_1178990 [marine sediment metagenome]|uniref:Uncharacterized protein n=1 Tax=marine sediment metagenome TaxID=412755 RepID=A0A0F9P5P9_9ZZZZ
MIEVLDDSLWDFVPVLGPIALALLLVLGSWVRKLWRKK